jgi:hypothetical protein
MVPTPTLVHSVAVVPRAVDLPNRRLHQQVRVSIVISAARCLFCYIVVPVLSRLVQPTLGHNPRIVIPLSLAALFFDARAIRSFSRSDHRWRWKIIAAYGLLMLGIIILLAHDTWRLAQ